MFIILVTIIWCHSSQDASFTMSHRTNRFVYPDPWSVELLRCPSCHRSRRKGRYSLSPAAYIASSCDDNANGCRFVPVSIIQDKQIYDLRQERRKLKAHLECKWVTRHVYISSPLVTNQGSRCLFPHHSSPAYRTYNEELVCHIQGRVSGM